MFSQLFLAGLASLATASPTPVKRDAASIVDAIDSIQSNIATLNNTLNTFTEGNLANSLTVLTIQSDNNNLQSSIDSAVTTASNSAPLNSSDSFTVASALLKLAPDVSSVLGNIVDHKPEFEAAILDLVSAVPQVEKDLQAQNASTGQLSDAIISKLASPYNQPGLTGIVTNQIFPAFDSAIAAFSTDSNILSLPPLFPTK